MQPTLIKEIEKTQMRKTPLPQFSQGDTVVVYVKVTEGARERLQAFEGTVIAIKNRGVNSSFTVRKVSHGEGVERVFQTHSPAIEKLEFKRHGKVRQAKLFYLRDVSGRKARIVEDLNKTKKNQLKEEQEEAV